MQISTYMVIIMIIHRNMLITVMIVSRVGYMTIIIFIRQMRSLQHIHICTTKHSIPPEDESRLVTASLIASDFQIDSNESIVIVLRVA